MFSKKLFSYLVLGAVLSSCTSDEMPQVSYADANVEIQTKSNIVCVEGIQFVQEDEMLSFATFDEFQEVVKSLKNSQVIISQLEYIPMVENDNILQLDNFKSMYKEYEEALEEADNYYDSETHYLEYKEKYSNLYFPEYMDDYSVYLPVSDKDVAKLLNVNGDVKINGNIVNMKDVSTYEKLVELGETMLDEKSSIMVYSDEYLNGTPEVRKGDNKLKVRVYTEPGSNGVGEVIVVDVSFRKKGFMGIWYNHKSKTTLGWVNGGSWSKSGFSSHDYKFARVYANGAPVKFAGEMYVDYEKFNGEKVYFKVDI